MTGSALAALAAYLLSLLFSYIPGFIIWFHPKSPDVKLSITSTLVVVVANQVTYLISPKNLSTQCGSTMTSFQNHHFCGEVGNLLTHGFTSILKRP